MGAKLGGSGGGSRYNIQSNSEINVTPFVDVMVLLIIFMVSIPAATVSIKLDMPPAVPPPPGAKPPDPPVFVSIQGENEFFIGRGTEAPRATTLDTMTADLAARINKPNFREEQVFVRAQAEVEYNSFMEVLNRLQDDGFYEIGLINEDIS